MEHCKMKYPHPLSAYISVLLAIGLEEEASFLLHQGYPVKIDNLTAALAYRQFLFVTDFVQIFIKLSPPLPPSSTELASLI